WLAHVLQECERRNVFRGIQWRNRIFPRPSARQLLRSTSRFHRFLVSWSFSRSRRPLSAEEVDWLHGLHHAFPQAVSLFTRVRGTQFFDASDESLPVSAGQPG